MKHLDLITKAKAGLILDQPFFATLLCQMPMIIDPSIPTMATDGESIRINPTWTETLDLSEVTFVLAHEVMHCVFLHMFRRGDRNPNKWNIATDYVINDLLVKEKVGTMPKGGLLNPKLVKDGGDTAEGVYNLLPQSDEKKRPGDKGGPLDDIEEPGGAPPPSGPDGEGCFPTPGTDSGNGPVDPAKLAEKEATTRVRIAQAKNIAKAQNKLSKAIDKLVKEMVKTETDWRSVLRRFLTERAKTDLSYGRPKRRFLAEDIYLPSLTGEKLGAIAVGVDCSGSIGKDELETFSSELRGIFEDAQPTEVKVYYFTDRLVYTETFGPDDDFQLTDHGPGGTAFSPVFEAINAEETLPVACVMLTDLCCDDFGDVPDYPVLWASTTDRSEVPFGEVTRIKQWRGR